MPKLDVASAFEEAVCVEGKQLEAGNIELVSLGSIPVVKGCLEHKLHQVAAWESPLSIDLLCLMLLILLLSLLSFADFGMPLQHVVGIFRFFIAGLRRQGHILSGCRYLWRDVHGCPTHTHIYIEIKAFQLRTFHFLDAFLDLHLRPCCSFWKQSFSHVSASEVSAFPFISNLSNRASDGTVRSFLSALSGAEEQLFGTSKRASNGIFKPFHTGGMWTFVEPC